MPLVLLSHRLSAEVDLFCHEADLVRSLLRELPSVAAEVGGEIPRGAHGR